MVLTSRSENKARPRRSFGVKSALTATAAIMVATGFIAPQAGTFALWHDNLNFSLSGMVHRETVQIPDPILPPEWTDGANSCIHFDSYLTVQIGAHNIRLNNLGEWVTGNVNVQTQWTATVRNWNDAWISGFGLAPNPPATTRPTISFSTTTTHNWTPVTRAQTAAISGNTSNATNHSARAPLTITRNFTNVPLTNNGVSIYMAVRDESPGGTTALNPRGQWTGWIQAAPLTFTVTGTPSQDALDMYEHHRAVLEASGISIVAGQLVWSGRINLPGFYDNHLNTTHNSTACNAYRIAASGLNLIGASYSYGLLPYTHEETRDGSDGQVMDEGGLQAGEDVDSSSVVTGLVAEGGDDQGVDANSRDLQGLTGDDVDHPQYGSESMDTPETDPSGEDNGVDTPSDTP